MQSYRLLLLDKDGRLLESRVIDSDEDQAAMEAAEDAVRRCEYVEIWKGGRPIGICARPLQQASRLRRLFRRWCIEHANHDKLRATNCRAPTCNHEARSPLRFLAKHSAKQVAK